MRRTLPGEVAQDPLPRRDKRPVLPIDRGADGGDGRRFVRLPPGAGVEEKRSGPASGPAGTAALGMSDAHDGSRYARYALWAGAIGRRPAAPASTIGWSQPSPNDRLM